MKKKNEKEDLDIVEVERSTETKKVDISVQANNFKALPYLLQRINESDYHSYVDQRANYRIRTLLDSCDSDKLEQTLQTLPESQRQLLRTMADNQSFFNKYLELGEIRDRECNIVANPRRTNVVEKSIPIN